MPQSAGCRVELVPFGIVDVGDGSVGLPCCEGRPVGALRGEDEFAGRRQLRPARARGRGSLDRYHTGLLVCRIIYLLPLDTFGTFGTFALAGPVHSQHNVRCVSLHPRFETLKRRVLLGSRSNGERHLRCCPPCDFVAGCIDHREGFREWREVRGGRVEFSVDVEELQQGSERVGDVVERLRSASSRLGPASEGGTHHACQVGKTALVKLHEGEDGHREPQGDFDPPSRLAPDFGGLGGSGLGRESREAIDDTFGERKSGGALVQLVFGALNAVDPRIRLELFTAIPTGGGRRLADAQPGELGLGATKSRDGRGVELRVAAEGGVEG